jgi:hypothetical protein
MGWYAASVDHQGREILLDDEPRFAGGAKIALAYAHLSVVFDKAMRAYSLTCDDEEGEAVRLILEPSELERIAREFLAAREWSRNAGVALAPFAAGELKSPGWRIGELMRLIHRALGRSGDVGLRQSVASHGCWRRGLPGGR